MALITESKNFWNQGDLRKRNIISMEQATWIQFRFGTFLYFNHCNFLSFVTALLENGPGWVETSCSKYNIQQSRMSLIFGFVHHFDHIYMN